MIVGRNWDKRLKSFVAKRYKIGELILKSAIK